MSGRDYVSNDVETAARLARGDARGDYYDPEPLDPSDWREVIPDGRTEADPGPMPKAWSRHG